MTFANSAAPEQELQTRPRGYKTFSMLNSVEHKILNAHKYIKKNRLFKGSDKPRMLFFLLTNIFMPIFGGILSFMSGKNLMFI